MNQCAYQYGTCTSLLHLFWGLVAPLPDIFPYTPPVPTLPGEHLSILQCPIPTPPPPLSSLCGHKLPNFRELTKMDKTSEDRINHHILNSALIVTMESDLPSRFYHIWSLSSLVHSAPAALYCSNESVILTFCKTIYFWRAEKEHSANVWVPPVAMLSLMLSLPPWNAFSSYLFSVNWTCIFFQGQLKSLDTFLNPLNRINCSPSVLPQNFILPAPLVPSHDPGEYKDHVSLTALPPAQLPLFSYIPLILQRRRKNILLKQASFNKKDAERHQTPLDTAEINKYPVEWSLKFRGHCWRHFWQQRHYLTSLKTRLGFYKNQT